MNKKNDQLLTITNLQVSIKGKKILQGVDLKVAAGSVHAVMGPNGSGKSTLAVSLLGHPGYQVLPGSQIKLGKTDVLNLPPEGRSRAGIFLAFQSPIAVPGVSVLSLLRTAVSANTNNSQQLRQAANNPALPAGGGSDWTVFTKKLHECAKILHIDESLLRRGINDGFSGGERKKMELLQALLLRPRIAVLDEIDTGLDVDALQVVAGAIKLLKNQRAGIIIVTHYQRILKYIKPDFVHILVDGKIIKTGGSRLSGEIEKQGYRRYIYAATN